MNREEYKVQLKKQYSVSDRSLLDVYYKYNGQWNEAVVIGNLRSDKDGPPKSTLYLYGLHCPRSGPIRKGDRTVEAVYIKVVDHEVLCLKNNSEIARLTNTLIIESDTLNMVDIGDISILNLRYLWVRGRTQLGTYYGPCCSLEYLRLPPTKQYVIYITNQTKLIGLEQHMEYDGTGKETDIEFMDPERWEV